MYKNKKILAVVPARSGSKGIKLKNIRTIDNIPLVGIAGNCLNSISEIDRSIVSTDSGKIAKIAEKFHLDAPFLRPASLSGDYVGDWEVLFHACNEIEKIDKVKYDIILMIQPTSPFRKPKHILNAIELLVKDNLDCVWSLSPTNSKYHPYKQIKIQNKKMNFFHAEGKHIKSRQELNKVYHRNGVVYAFSRECILEHKTIFGINNKALILDEILVNIDDELDFQFAEFLGEL